MVDPEPTSSEQQHHFDLPEEGADAAAVGDAEPAPTTDQQPITVARSRHAGRARARRRAARTEPGVTLAVASVVVLIAVILTALLGWVALLVVVAVGQVLLARGWVDYLEVPGAIVVATGLLVVAAVAAAGIVVARVSVEAGDRPDDLVQLAPVLAVVFPLAVLAQLARRDEDPRQGALAGLVASCSGGVLVVGLAMWLPLAGSEAGTGWVVAGVAGCAVTGIVVGLVDWLRGTGRANVLLLALLLAGASAPLYVAARITSG